jgi:thiamine biosynthesis lipoprotein
MGTVASLTFDAVSPDSVDLRPIHTTFEHFDTTYSLFNPESELSRIAARQLELSSASEEVRETYAVALQWRAASTESSVPIGQTV